MRAAIFLSVLLLALLAASTTGAKNEAHTSVSMSEGEAHLVTEEFASDNVTPKLVNAAELPLKRKARATTKTPTKTTTKAGTTKTKAGTTKTTTKAGTTKTTTKAGTFKTTTKAGTTKTTTKAGTSTTKAGTRFCPNTEKKDTLQCRDGTYCNASTNPQGGKCCSGHGGRYRCPSNFPVMCTVEDCGDGYDYCCATSAANCVEISFAGYGPLPISKCPKLA